MWRLMSNW